MGPLEEEMKREYLQYLAEMMHTLLKRKANPVAEDPRIAEIRKILTWEPAPEDRDWSATAMQWEATVNTMRIFKIRQLLNESAKENAEYVQAQVMVAEPDGDQADVCWCGHMRHLHSTNPNHLPCMGWNIVKTEGRRDRQEKCDCAGYKFWYRSNEDE